MINNFSYHTEKPWLNKECKLERRKLRSLLGNCKKSDFSEETKVLYNKQKLYLRSFIYEKKRELYIGKLDALSKAKNPETSAVKKLFQQNLFTR